jgi:hypothetical protein
LRLLMLRLLMLRLLMLRLVLRLLAADRSRELEPSFAFRTSTCH